MTGTSTPHDLIASARKRTGMYVGDTGVYGLHHLAYFLLDAVYWDARRGDCGDLALEVGADGALSLFSTSRFVDPAEMVEVVTGRGFHLTPMTRAWGWGNSLPVALALSSLYEVETWDGGRQWRLLGVQGRPSGDVVEVVPAEPPPVGDARGMRIRLIPDATIFEAPTFDVELLSRRCRELAFLAPRLRARVTDHRTGEATRMHYPLGITQRLQELTADVPRLHPEPLAFDVEWDGFRVRCALQWCEAEGAMYSYANTVRTRRQGVHVDGVYLALRGALSVLTGERTLLFSRRQLARGLRAIVAADGAEDRMTFAGPTRELLAIEGLAAAVGARLRPVLVEALREHPLTPWLVTHGRVRPRPAVVARRRTPD
ncbi:DNA gyrase subunit B [Pyxidicoccus sp. 3LFB2]